MKQIEKYQLRFFARKLKYMRKFATSLTFYLKF